MSATLFDDNPFFVLGVPVTATSLEAEREGRKLLAMLELGLASARAYASPLGPRELTPERVRQAMADLRDPDTRVVAEAIAHAAGTASTTGTTLAAWTGARAALGWREPSSP